nr:MAG TPA: hypothetical protein [Caudoviricetes sp.]
MRHLDLITGDSSLTAQTAARALSEARSAQTASVGSVAVRNQDGSYTTIGAQASGGGGIDLGSTGDLTWRDGTVQHSARRLQLQLSEVQQKLAGGGHISSATGGNHISLSAPNTTEGYADGAFWTRVASATDMTVQQVWKKVDGAWVEQDVSQSTLIAPTIDAGLISVASLAAKMIVSGEMWSSATNPRYGITEDGLLGYDANGNETVHLDGQDNRLAGTATVGGLTLKHWGHESDTEGTSAIFRDIDGRGVDAPESYALTAPGILFRSKGREYAGVNGTAGATERFMALHASNMASRDSAQLSLSPGSFMLTQGNLRENAESPFDFELNDQSGVYANDANMFMKSKYNYDSQLGAWLEMYPSGRCAMVSRVKRGAATRASTVLLDADGDTWVMSYPEDSGVHDTSNLNSSGVHFGVQGSRGFVDFLGRLGTSFTNSTFKIAEWTQYVDALNTATYTFQLPQTSGVWMPLLSPLGSGDAMPILWVEHANGTSVSVRVRNVGQKGGTCGCVGLFVQTSDLSAF